MSSNQPPENLGKVGVAILGGEPDSSHVSVLGIEHPIGNIGHALCTATVIEVKPESALLLTAAHCVTELDDNGEVLTPVTPINPKLLKATVGISHDADVRLGDYFAGGAIFIAPDYDGFVGSPNDVAVVRIAGATGSLHAMTVAAVAPSAFGVGSAVTLVGFGQTENPDDSGNRRTTTQTVAWENTQFVGFDQTNGRGICSGDSGGPVLWLDGAVPTVVAVNAIAAGTMKDACNKGATATRVNRFTSLINEASQATPQGGEAGAGNDGKSETHSGSDGDCAYSPGPMAHGSAALLWCSMVSAFVVARRRRARRRRPGN
jgi:hypothetical protein